MEVQRPHVELSYFLEKVVCYDIPDSANLSTGKGSTDHERMQIRKQFVSIQHQRMLSRTHKPIKGKTRIQKDKVGQTQSRISSGQPHRQD
jgi:hypothetical protein